MKRWFVVISDDDGELYCVSETRILMARWDGRWKGALNTRLVFQQEFCRGHGAIIESDSAPSVEEARTALEERIAMDQRSPAMYDGQANLWSTNGQGMNMYQIELPDGIPLDFEDGETVQATIRRVDKDV